MTVTPVAKHPRALRNSADLTVMEARKYLPSYTTPGNDLSETLAREATPPPRTRDSVSPPPHVSFVHSHRQVRLANLTGIKGIHSRDGSLTAFLDELSAGLPLSRERACQLLHCPDDDLSALLAAARAAKQRFKPGVITYSRKV